MYVGITSRLRQDVAEAIRKMKCREADALGDMDAPLITESDIEPALWGDHLHLRNVIPSAWKSTIKSCNASLKATLSSGKTTERNFTAHFDTPIDAPPHYNDYRFRADLTHLPAMAAAVEWVRNSSEVELRWEKVKTDVDNFLANCKSLNEALKLYPDIAIYIPKPYLDKVEEKKEVSEKKESEAARVLKGIDTDALKAAAVMARMS